MPNLLGDNTLGSFELESLSFGVSLAAISQTAVALKLNVNAATSGSLNITGVSAPWDGSIVGITANLTANKTAGVLTFTPTINGTAIATPSALVAVPVANATSAVVKTADAQQSGARFVKGAVLGVKFTTDGSYAPTTNDIYVTLWVVYEGVQL